MEDDEMVEAPVQTVSISDFKTMLRFDIVEFKYLKKDGTERIAFGTKNPSIISSYLGPAVGGSKPARPPKIGYVTYFDVEKGSFRMFLEDNFIGVIDEHAKAPVAESVVMSFESYINAIDENIVEE